LHLTVYPLCSLGCEYLLLTHFFAILIYILLYIFKTVSAFLLLLFWLILAYLPFGE
jgi:hypothetical protein